MARNWYGVAQSARQAPRSANAARTLARVGGVNSRSSYGVSVDAGTCRAVYGSTDHAAADHSNDPLCRALDIESATKLHTARHYTGTAYERNVYRKADMQTVHGVTPVSASDIDALIRCATAHNQSLVEYCDALGIALN